MDVLVIAAHPDDEVLGVGGTMVKHVSSGDNVYVYIVTDGSSTQYEGNSKILEKKKEEAKKANFKLGVKEIIFGNLPDMKLDTIPHVQINKEISKVIEKIKPQIVYTHHYGDLNKDHQEVYKSTLVACRPYNSSVKELYLYEIPSSSEWGEMSSQIKPMLFQKLTKEELELKIEAMKEYESELREYPHPRSLEGIINLSKFRGQMISKEYAEVFEIVRIER